MREIKFKFYSKNVNSGSISVREASLDELENADSWQGNTPWRRIATCQYTGLKDKNGKEIYEGDILEKNKGEYSKEVVKYGGVQNDYESGGYCYGIYLEWDIDSYEVIGNIWENPELVGV